MSLRPDQLGKPLKVLKRIKETHDAVSLVLEIPEALRAQFHYQAGQFVTFFLNLKGEALNRSYSLSSAPGVDPEFKITVKKVHGGRASTYLCEQVKEGDVLLTAPPAGLFFKPPPEFKNRHFVLIAAGSGITPVFSILKTVLKASDTNHVTLLFCNRNEDSIIYREEIDQLAKLHPTRLKVIHALTQPKGDWTGYRGRLTESFLRELIQTSIPNTTRDFYLCGPTEFMTAVRLGLTANGVTKDQLHEEDFAISLHKPAMDVDAAWTFIGEDIPTEPPEKIIAMINGETIEVAAKVGQNILETLLEAGAQPPYSCMDGACMACLAKISQGRVYQEDPGILTDDNIAAREMLTCQAKPLSRIVKISFDDL